MQNKILDILSDTEYRYAKLTVDECLSRKEIARRMCLSEDTVATTMKNIYRKLNITKLTELSKIFYKGTLLFLIIYGTVYVNHNPQISRIIQRRVEPIETQMALLRIRRPQRGKAIPLGSITKSVA